MVILAEMRSGGLLVLSKQFNPRLNIEKSPFKCKDIHLP